MALGLPVLQVDCGYVIANGGFMPSSPLSADITLEGAGHITVSSVYMAPYNNFVPEHFPAVITLEREPPITMDGSHMAAQTADLHE